MDKGEGGGGGGGGGGSRFSTAKAEAAGFGGIRGDLQVSEKSKKEKLRSLSAVSKELSSNYQMGSHLSHKPNASRSSSANRFKLPKKRRFLHGCNGVDHASVPRKIRSAMKKRGRESTLLSDSEKVSHKINNGTESPEKDAIKKSKKQGSPEWSTRKDESGPITKDEEEVVASLFVLAGMFPNNGSDGRTELECESLPDNSLALQDPGESANATFEASGITHDASPCPDRSPEGDAKLRPLNETSGEEQTDFPESAKFLAGSDSNDPKLNLQAMPTMVRTENSSEVALHESELCLAMGLNMPRQSHTSHIGRKPDVEFQKAGGVDSKQEYITKEQKMTEGLALWPGLSPRASAGVNASYLQSTAAKAPDWLNAACCASKQDIIGSCSSGGKMPEVGFRKKLWKKCAAHVHISHLIQSLEASKRQAPKEAELHESQQMRVPQRSNGVYTEGHNFNGQRNRISSAPGTVQSAAMRNSHETENGSLQQLCHYLDRSQGPATPVLDSPQKQSFNFLSLSAGSNRLKVNDGVNIVGSRSEPFSKLQVPYFQSIQQQHGLMPMPTPQSQYASTSYLDRLPVAGPQVRLQQTHYHGSPLCGSHYSSAVSNKQQLQNFWAVQLASQGRSAVNSNIVRAQYPNWQSGRQDYSAAHFILPHSPALGPKITAISEQQLLALASSLPPSRTKGLDIHLPSACDEGRFPSLQLLCDERI